MKIAFSVLAGAVGAAAGLMHGSPVQKRQNQNSDDRVLNFALALEQLETAFYAEGLHNYTHQEFLDAGFPDPFYTNLQQVATNERAHVDFLTQALTDAGAHPVSACEYDFPSTDPKSFVALANILEGVGVSAYAGAAAQLDSDRYVTGAASILGIEGRHSAFFRAALGLVPFRPFEVPLDFAQVNTLVAPFIVSCPTGKGKLPFQIFPPLTIITDERTVQAGATVTVDAGEHFRPTDHVFAAFITLLGPVFADLRPEVNGRFSVTVPEGIMGQSYLVLTSSDREVTHDTILAGPGIVQVGPVVGTPCDDDHDDNGRRAVSMASGGAKAGSSSEYTNSAGKTVGNVAGSVLASVIAAALVL
ncbi:hypothetical protein PHISP_04929 [Aspergillus sp. HF37]|nr:hypothetical protein PHISP_04929 [Aspergillus sp. HF37]